MKTNQLNKEIQKLNLPYEQKSAILQIIDLKNGRQYGKGSS